MKESEYQSLATMVLSTEAEAIRTMQSRINDDFLAACQHLIHCQGHIIVTGIGKSGHIANKIAATLASTGSPAFYLHPAEAHHGDFGRIQNDDAIILLSHSGETEEINLLLPSLKHLQIKTIAITGAPNSTLGKSVDICLDASIEQEACPLGLAPTASTTAALALGDALAITVSQAKGFTAEDFARTHPGGKLGRQLLLSIRDIMHTGDNMPMVSPDTLLKDALYEISAKRLGMTLILGADGNKPIGIFTDGDLRRTLDQGTDIHKQTIGQCMSTKFHTIADTALAIEALSMMEESLITALPVLNEQQDLVGVVHIHDLLQAGI